MNTTRLLRLVCGLAAAIGVMPMLTACGYTLHGRVIRGQTPGVEIVHEMDLRMRSPAGGGPTATPEKSGLMPAGAGVNNVEVSIYRDPKTLNKKLADRDRSNGEGYFTLHLGKFGTGWMDEQWQVVTSVPGYGNVSTLVKLPVNGGKWRLLITVVPGTQTPAEPDVMQQMEQFK